MPSAQVGKSYETYQYGRIRVTAIMGDTVFFYVFDGYGSKSTVEVSKARFLTLTEEKPEREPEASVLPVEKKKPVPAPVLERKAAEKPEEQKKAESDDDLIDGGFIGFRPRHINTVKAKADNFEEDDEGNAAPFSDGDEGQTHDGKEQETKTKEAGDGALPPEDGKDSSHLGKQAPFVESDGKWGERHVEFSCIFIQRLSGEKHGARQFNYRVVTPGQPVIIVPTPGNPYDSFAIELFTIDGLSLGFIPRSVNQEMAQKIGQGFVYVGNVYEVVPGYDSMSSKIDIMIREFRPAAQKTIFIQKQPTEEESKTPHSCPFTYRQIISQPRWDFDDDSRRGGGHHNDDDE
jgi:hypothetical protein